MSLAKATSATCGAKAAACAELAQLAEKNKKKGGFGTAAGVCLPFGSMEAVIKVNLIPPCFPELYSVVCMCVIKVNMILSDHRMDIDWHASASVWPYDCLLICTWMAAIAKALSFPAFLDSY